MNKKQSVDGVCALLHEAERHLNDSRRLVGSVEWANLCIARSLTRQATDLITKVMES